MREKAGVFMTLLSSPLYAPWARLGVSLGIALAASIPLTSHGYALSSLNDLVETGTPQQPTTAVAAPAMATVEEATQGKPNQAVTRYQMVTTIANLMDQLQKDIQTLEEQKADKEQIDQVRALFSQLGQQLAHVTQDIEANNGKDLEQDKRLGLLEKVQIHGDMSLGAIADMSRNGLNGSDTVPDAISSVARLRLSFDVPVVTPESDTSLLGPGGISSRIIAAMGRYGPSGSDSNAGANYTFNAYSRVAADVSAFNEGFGTGSVGGTSGPNLFKQSGLTSYSRPNVYLESAFYKQNLREGVPLLTDLPGLDLDSDNRKGFTTSADLYAGIVRWWDIFDVSPYRGNEMAQFQNNAFINIPGIAVNYAQPMVAYTLHQGLGESASADFSVGLGSPDAGDFLNAMNLTYEAKLFYTPRFLPEKFQKPGSIYAGGYHIWSSGNRDFVNLFSYTRRDGTSFNANEFDQYGSNSVYAGWNQEWWRGIGTNVGFVWNQGSPSIIMLTTQQPGPANVAIGAKSAFTSVVTVPLSAIRPETKRTKDLIGLGYAYAQMQDGKVDLSAISGTGLEHVVEGFYRFQVNDAFSIIPSFQVIGTPLGLNQNGFNTVLGCRLNYTF
jgi:DNA-binding transcriptional regulator YbjK